MRFQEIERRLLVDGWRLKAQAGSHRQYAHPSKPRKVTVPDHRGGIPPNTVRMIRKAK